MNLNIIFSKWSKCKKTSINGVVLSFITLLVFTNQIVAQKLLDPAASSGPISVVVASSGGVNTSISVAYSIRQLKTTYDHVAITPPAAVTGFTNSSTPLLRVKRSFDNALLDIGYDGNGNLDTVTLKNFVSGKVGVAAPTNPTADGRVNIWYDQSGNSKDASLGSAIPCPGLATEPFIITAGVVERNGAGQIGIAGKNGGMIGDGGTAYDLAASGFNRYGITGDRTQNVVTQPRAWSTVGAAGDGAGTYLVDRNGGTGIQDNPLTSIKAVGNFWSLQIRNDAGTGFPAGSFAGIIPISVNRSDNVTVVRSGDNYPMYVNGVHAGTGTLTGTNSMSPVRIGYGCTSTENVYYGEFILFPSALSNANLTAINSSQSVFFALGSVAGIWTGVTSSDWNVATNWSTNEVPTVITDVEIPSGTPFNLNITGGQTNLVARKLTVKVGSTITIDGNVSVSGNVIVNGTINGTGTLTMSGTFDQTISGTPSANLVNLVIANTTDTVTATTDLNLSGTLTVNANAIFSLGATNVINSSAAAGTITGNGTVLVTRVASTADFQSQYKFLTYTLTNLSVNYFGTGAQTINLGVNYSNLLVSGTGIKTLSAAITATNVTGNITVNAGTFSTNNFSIGSPAVRTITVAAGATMDAGTSVISFGATTKQMTINGTFQTANLNGFSGTATTAIANTNTPTITLGAASTIEYTAAAAQVVTTLTTYANVTLSNGSKTITGTNTISGNLTINTGATYNGAANPVLTVNGNFTNSGTFTSGTGLVTFGGTSAQSISSTTTPLVFSGSVTFSGAASTATMSVNATAAGLTINASKTLRLGTFTFNGTAGTLTVNGTLQLGANTGGQTGSNFPTGYTLAITGGTVEYNGSNAITQTVFATTYGNLTLTNGSGSGTATKISTGNIVVNTPRIFTINSLTEFNPAAANIISGTGTITGTGTLYVSGADIPTQYTITTKTLTNLNIVYSGSASIAAGTYASIVVTAGTLTLTSGPINVTGNVTIGVGTTLAGGTVTLNVAGNWTNDGTYTSSGAGSVNFNGTVAQTIGGTTATSFTNLTISNTTAIVSVNTNANISNTLTVNASAQLQPAAGVVLNTAAAVGTITGNGTIYVTRIIDTADYQNQYKFLTNTLTNLTVNYAGLGVQTINLGVNYSNVIVSGSGIKTMSAAVTATNITGNITVNTGTFATNNFAIGSPANRTITVAAGATMDAGTSVITFGATTKTIIINGTFQTANLNGFSGGATRAIANTNTPTITLGTGSTIEYSAAGAAQAVTARTDYQNVILTGVSKTISGTITILGNLTINTGATYNGAANPVLTVNGNFSNSGTFTCGTGLVTFGGTSNQSITSTTTLVFGGGVTFSGAASTATMGVNATVATTLTVNTGKTLDLGLFSMNRATSAAGPLTVAGTLKLGNNTGGQTGSNFPSNFTTRTLTGGTVEYNGSNGITQTVFATTYNNLVLTNGTGSGTATKNSTASFVVTGGTFTVNSLVEFIPAALNVISGTGTITGTGTIHVTGTSLATQYTLTKTLTNLSITYSGGTQSIPAGTYSSLNVSGGGTKTLTGVVLVVNSVNIATAADILDANSNSLSVAGNWINNGTFTPGATGTVTFNGTSTQTISGTSLTAFTNLTVTNTTSPLVLNRNINVTGTLNLNGAATAITPDDTVVINNGGAGTSILTGTGNVKVTRIASIADMVNQYKFNTYTLNNITLDYAGAGAQTINNTVGTYGALRVSGSGTKTLQGNITVTNDVTFVSGSFATGGFNLTTSGNWVNNGVSMSGTGNINLNGATKTISGTTVSTFPGLVIGSGATYTMNNNNTATSLTFTASATASSLTHGTNNSFTVTGNVTVNQPTAAFTTNWIINTATISVNGTLGLGGANATANRIAQITLTTGTLSILGNTTITGGLAANTVINMSGGAGTLNFGGTVTLATVGTLTPGTTSTVNFNGAVAQTIPFSTTFIYNNVNVTNSNIAGATFGAAVTATNLVGNLTVVSGLLNTNNVAVAMANTKTLTLSAGATLDAGTTSILLGTGSVAVAINGIFKTANTAGFSGTAATAIRSTNTPAISQGASSTVEYNVTGGGQTVTVAQAYNNLKHNNTSGTNTANGNVVVNGTLTTTAGGTFALSTFTLTGTLTSIVNAGTITTAVPTATSATPIPTGKNWGAGIVSYNAATGVQTIVAGTYGTLTMGNTSGTQTAGGNITTTTLNNNTAGIILNMSTFTLAATTITNNATATIRTQNTSVTPLPTGLTIGGIVTYDAASGAQTVRGNTYTTLTMGNTSGTQTAGGNITTTTLNNNTAGIILDMATFTLAATTITNNATATIRTQSLSATPIPTGITIAGTVNYDATTGGQTIRPNTYTNLTISNTSGSQTASGNIVVNGTLTTTAGGILDLVSNTLSGTLGTITNNGTIATQSLTAAIPTGRTWGGTINYNALAGGQAIVSATSYNNLTLGNTSGLQTVAANLVVNGTLTTTAGGTLDLVTFTLSGTLGTITNNGTIATQSTTAAIPTGRAWGGTVNYNRINGGQSVVSAVSYNNLTLSNTSNTQTSAANLVVDGTLTTSAGGTFALSTFTLSGTLATIANNGTISTANLSATPIPSGRTWGGRVFYFATTGSQTLVSGVYNTLEMRNTSGTNTMSGDMTVNTDFNFSIGGKAALGSNTLTLNGTLTDHSATSTFASNGSSSIVIGGSGALGSNLFLDQTTPGTSNRLTDLTYNRSSQTITLGNAMQITGTVTPTAGTLATGGFLTLVSDATNTARIADGGCTTCSYITGNVHVQRNIPATARRWRFMGSPVTTSTLADWQAETYITGTGGAANGFDATLSNQASVFSYNESITTGDLNTGWVAASNTTNTLDVGKGYRLFIRGDRSDAGRLTGTVTTQNEVTLDLVGEPNQGDIVMPVTFNSSGTLANDGWNLVSNPYASPYDWDAHYDDGSFHTNIDPTIQILSAITGAYDSYTATGNTGSLTGGIIPPGASFWVKANAGSPSLTFKEQFKVGTTPVGVFKTNENESFSIQLYLDSNTSDKVFVKYMGAATANYDNYDIIKLGAAVSISAYGNDNVMLAASVRPVVNNAVDTVKLKVTAAAGNYKLKFANSNQIAVQENVFLIDSYLSTVTDLKVTNEYPFSIVTGVSATQGLNRFYIVVANNTSLPVKLLTFGARATAEKTVALNWATAQETNNDRFMVEHSSNGIDYETIGEVKGNGNTSTLINYTFTDKQPSSVNYYRLKQVDYDGTATYSAVRNVNFGQPNLGLTMYPIPAKEVLTISHVSNITSLHIYDVTGKEVYTANKLNSTATIEVEQLVQGIYFVELTDETGTTYKDKFVKE